MRLVIRADATRATGTGHVMRSCVIAESAVSVGIDCLFVGNLGGIEWLENKVKEIGFSEILHDVSELKINTLTDVLVLDTYDDSESTILDLEWLGKIVIVDPISPNFRADLRFHTGLQADWNKDSDSQFYGCGEYILVRKELREVQSIPKNMDSRLDIMVTGGGSDPFDFCAEIASVLLKFEDDFRVNFITDAPGSIPRDSRFFVFPPGKIFKELLPRIDLVFTPASTTCLEMLSLGIPQGIAKIVENQDSNYQILTKEGSVLGIGSRNSSGMWEFNLDEIAKLVRSSSLRNSLSEKKSVKYDSLGSERMIRIILDFYT